MLILKNIMSLKFTILNLINITARYGNYKSQPKLNNSSMDPKHRLNHEVFIKDPVKLS